MKISTKGRYGLRALVDLAAHAQDNKMSLVNIANRQKLSLNYLEQVFATLRKAGIIKSVKGAQGGYMLAKEPQDIKVAEILRVLEGEFCIVDNTDAGKQQDSVQKAIKELVWDRIDQSINEFLDQITLADLVERYEVLHADEKMMYYI